MDHIHCFVSAPPKLSITDIIKYLKGITGRKLFEEYQEIREQLWEGQLDQYINLDDYHEWQVLLSHWKIAKKYIV